MMKEKTAWRKKVKKKAMRPRLLHRVREERTHVWTPLKNSSMKTAIRALAFVKLLSTQMNQQKSSKASSRKGSKRSSWTSLTLTVIWPTVRENLR